MKNLNQFHDGSLEGLLIEGGKVQIFLRTEVRKAFVLELDGTLSLKADGFRQTSSIFHVLVREGDEVAYDVMSLTYMDLRMKAKRGRSSNNCAVKSLLLSR